MDNGEICVEQNVLRSAISLALEQLWLLRASRWRPEQSLPANEVPVHVSCSEVVSGPISIAYSKAAVILADRSECLECFTLAETASIDLRLHSDLSSFSRRPVMAYWYCSTMDSKAWYLRAWHCCSLLSMSRFSASSSPRRSTCGRRDSRLCSQPRQRDLGCSRTTYRAS